MSNRRPDARGRWLTAGSADAPLATFRLIEFILFSLSKEGWSLALSAGMPGKHNARDTFFFVPAARRQRRFFSVIFGTHMVTLLDAPDQRVCEAFVQACEVCTVSFSAAVLTPRHGQAVLAPCTRASTAPLRST